VPIRSKVSMARNSRRLLDFLDGPLQVQANLVRRFAAQTILRQRTELHELIAGSFGAKECLSLEAGDEVGQASWLNSADVPGVFLPTPNAFRHCQTVNIPTLLDSLRKCATFSGVAPPPEYGLLFLCSAWARELRLSEPCERRLRGGAFQGKSGSLSEGKRHPTPNQYATACADSRRTALASAP
jgi:hypothetical protein